ncbi:cob(I)yrinic acid a,c-diamide adenosyltransferase [Syntrophobacter fumaroxidans]|uniref:corrinoid adenosyltransferase n=1 Tax=Syntrophobacter fumaroxidans (strain DSM 10017 / MPOB) TaxID=335543 RepID=A0LLP5_SYNFM|nr:cob(I)yrinic acid a,c-diamide adenosyltransferase [Syntrophobacter fumaroxidans]ABK18347.1 cob(I)yrinic acid a,c-diamide adenosyltransferase [Syntrophobacter fumaroxidans MPOB]
MATRKVDTLHPRLEVTHLKPSKRVGLIVVLTGYGKGKTSSAVGMAVRACGHGMKVCMIQFMKGDIYTGEWDGIDKMDCDVELIRTGMGFCGIKGNPYPHPVHREAAQQALRLAREKLDSGGCDLLVLDEINNALHLNLLDLDQVLDLLHRKPPLTHLVLTGRDAHPDVMELADTVSEVREIKHAYRKDIEAQPGIDY